MRSLLIALPLSMLATAAFAADAVVEAEIVPVLVWTGGYVGLQAGYSWGDTDQVFGNGDNTHPDADGWLGGIYVGYNYQFANNVVVGVDGDFAWSDADGESLNYDPSGGPFPPSNIAYADVDWTGAVRARLGYAVDRFLPYVAGGFAFTKATWRDTSSGAEYDRVDETYTGWTLGGGVEYAFTDNIIGRAEYRYSDFGEESDNDSTVELKANDVRFGIAYKF